MIKTLNITISGAPIAKKRPRFARRGKFVQTYNEQQTEEGKFITIMMSQITRHSIIPAGTPIELECIFEMPVPKTMPKKHIGTAYHVKKPDLDNCVKFFKDCANGILWHDDSQVIRTESVKRYAWDGQPKTIITLTWGE